jgi:hypothetical protein
MPLQLLIWMQGRQLIRTWLHALRGCYAQELCRSYAACKAGQGLGGGFAQPGFSMSLCLLLYLAYPGVCPVMLRASCAESPWTGSCSEYQPGMMWKSSAQGCEYQPGVMWKSSAQGCEYQPGMMWKSSAQGCEYQPGMMWKSSAQGSPCGNACSVRHVVTASIHFDEAHSFLGYTCSAGT